MLSVDGYGRCDRQRRSTQLVDQAPTSFLLANPASSVAKCGREIAPVGVPCVPLERRDVFLRQRNADFDGVSRARLSHCPTRVGQKSPVAQVAPSKLATPDQKRWLQEGHAAASRLSAATRRATPARVDKRILSRTLTPLNSTLPTTLFVPLDLLAAPYQGRELLVHVPAAEAGTKRDQVAIVTHLRFAPSDRFEPGRVGKLGPETLDELDEKLRLVLDL